MSFITNGGGMDTATFLTSPLVCLVPGWHYAGTKIQEGYQMTTLQVGLPIALGIVAIILLVTALVHKEGMTSVMLSQGASKAGKRSDAYAFQGSPNKADTFLSGNVGPEFVEQPNYVLGQEDMQRTALTKYTRMKAQGAAVGDWKTFWATYKAENGEDVGSSLYDFGDGFNGKDLNGALRGTR